MEKEKKDSQLPDEIVKLQKHRIMLWCVIIIIGLLAIDQFAFKYCENKVLADQFTFASTISSIILSVIAIIMSVVSSDSINNLLHKFRDLHSEIKDVPTHIDSSITLMNQSAGKFEKIYDDLENAPQKIEESTGLMKEVSKHVDDSIENLLRLIEDIQLKTKNWHEMSEDIKEIKEGVLNKFTVTTDLKSEESFKQLSEQQAKIIMESGSVSGCLLLYAAKLAKDKKRYLSLYDLGNDLDGGTTSDYYFGYLIAMIASGMISVNKRQKKKKVYEIVDYNPAINSVKDFLLSTIKDDKNLISIINSIEEQIEENAETVTTDEDEK